MKKYISLIILTIIVFSCKENKPTYKNPNESFENRAKHLVSLMTLEEKVSQMSYESPAIERLEIPEYNWWNECLHGVARAGVATVFPQAIGMGAMWDKQQMFRVANAISDEARAKHHEFASRNKRGIYQGLTYWTPNINIFRDPRWGRGMETYGEDPYLTGELGVQFIKGLQGDDPTYYKLIATAKHFVVHSGPEISRHSFNVTPTPYDMVNTYSPQFEKVIKQAGVYSIMCAYNSYDGLPCCGNTELSDLLRNKWGFKGYIVSDCWAIKDFYNKGAHEVSENQQEAAAMAVKAGTDLNCGDSYPALVEAVKNGHITEDELNVSLERLIVARLKLGLFAPEGAVKYEKIPYDVVDSETHRLLALETSRKSLVLLKNENNLLPFSKDVKKVAVIGPNSDDLEVLLGNYNGYPSNPITPLKGIIDKLPDAEVNFAVGCKTAEGLPIFEVIPTSVLFTDETLQTNGLNAAYYSNLNCEGTPNHSQIDKNVDFIWRTKAPFSDMKYDHFSVRWTGYLSVQKTGKYALGGEAFSGMKLYLDDKLLVEREDVHHPKKEYEYVSLEAGKKYKIKLEYKQNNTDYAIMRFLWEAPTDSLEQEAIEIAKKSDLIVLCMGLSPLLEGEEMKVKVDGFSGGDRLDVKLPKTQTDLMKKLNKLGKPMVLVLLNGSAVAINWENDNIPAIIEAWYPGQAGGTAIADVIFGDYNPAGRLPLTFYKDINDIPEFSEYDMKGKTYRYFKGEALYPFGYGLSYTNFKYSDLKIQKEISTNQNLKVSVDITNKGEFNGEEVVQLYATRLKDDGLNPTRLLLGFNRIHLNVGETKTVEFTVTPKQLAIVNKDYQQVVINEEISISVGGEQPETKGRKSNNVVSEIVTIKGTPFLIENN
ncbi:glycoside hydrolase family 3 C-terminal domain-containing protein [Lutibacter sp. A80]|uniref:glycoside hydrolase family 3 C-terminal domain-containing protein n=1 Tax=Lutibacter sp. A80 TaxID=2918453 RepID=UPI001F065EDE|nr:glycoside hydrolase family 3 C-terminal domain-containing protein [Lutibacter sp. A80]UMB60981.1 glycoside hydrolase family 3 C-terminal domain-containing protein [Lutibacter sp. A80]